MFKMYLYPFNFCSSGSCLSVVRKCIGRSITGGVESELSLMLSCGLCLTSDILVISGFLEEPNKSSISLVAAAVTSGSLTGFFSIEGGDCIIFENFSGNFSTFSIGILISTSILSSIGNLFSSVLAAWFEGSNCNTFSKASFALFHFCRPFKAIPFRYCNFTNTAVLPLLWLLLLIKFIPLTQSL
ncbi:conserved hypothetical protein [Candida albicans WO-1]|uniref:Uncharacterized protein n=2 Tax=Candida albicans TaxID=5476 RepID=Q5A856_CANAL|nr:uncharacterized protein CAALFM_CR00840CA [Candida albicans SC5314]AOW30849.1 hypothetical protein CAALFM_CR00840CA [Candida albicans SC5314]EEQ43213.1 conserved hypothetical protein [Candida albicans WO-1]|eukprot:XP_717961.1 hypothetical protein CAALFM_CR00840CA [Candida albicans SC5314]